MRHGCVLYTVIFPQKRKVQFSQPFISVVSQQSRLERGRVPNVISWCLVLDQVISLDLRWWDWTIQSPLLQRTTLHCTKNWKVSLSPGRAGGPEAASLRKSWRRQRQSWDALELGTLCSECSQKLKAWSLFTNCKLLQRRRMLHFLDTRLGSIDMYRHLSLPPTLNPWSL